MKQKTDEELLSEALQYTPLFYLLDKTDDRIIAVKQVVENGYDGFSVKIDRYNKFNLSPIFVAKTYIANTLISYDFTNNHQTALTFLKS